MREKTITTLYGGVQALIPLRAAEDIALRGARPFSASAVWFSVGSHGWGCYMHARFLVCPDIAVAAELHPDLEYISPPVSQLKPGARIEIHEQRAEVPSASVIIQYYYDVRDWELRNPVPEVCLAVPAHIRGAHIIGPKQLGWSARHLGDGLMLNLGLGEFVVSCR